MQDPPAQIDALLDVGRSQLSAAGVADAGLEARLLLQFVTGLSRTQLLLDAGTTLNSQIVTQYRHLLRQRCQRIPLQHLTGLQEFWSFELHVSPAVLIPRPETEFLVEQILATLPAEQGMRVLDMCTGSGAIALVLAKEFSCPVVAVDLSSEALAIASQNRAKYHLEGQVCLVQSDLFAALAPTIGFDCIVSNPPYIVEGVIDQLEPEVAQFEPRLALSGGADGLRCIERIIAEAPDYLRAGGWLFLEIGSDQKKAVTELFEASGRYEQIQVLNDYTELPRVARARLIRR